MAAKIEVSVKVVGGRMKVVEVNDGAAVSDVITAAALDGKYLATINSNPAELTDVVEEGMTIFLAPQVKGNGGDNYASTIPVEAVGEVTTDDDATEEVSTDEAETTEAAAE